jgi:hypothetical protein
VCSILSFIGFVGVTVWANRTGLAKDVAAWWLIIVGLLAFLAGWLMNQWRLKQKLFGGHQDGISRIRFDYLPDSPTKHGWELVEGTVNPPVHSVASDGPTQECIELRSHGKYAVDFKMPEKLRHSDKIEYYAKYSVGATFYIQVQLSTRDGIKVREGWIAIFPGKAPPKQESTQEWSVHFPATPLGSGWLRFELSLPEMVESTFGRDGWVYDRLNRIRLRGNICLSPIDLVQH